MKNRKKTARRNARRKAARRKFFLSTLFVTVFIAVLVHLSSPHYVEKLDGRELYVTFQELNLRAEPDGEIISILDYGDMVALTGYTSISMDEEWSEVISSSGILGWVRTYPEATLTTKLPA